MSRLLRNVLAGAALSAPGIVFILYMGLGREVAIISGFVTGLISVAIDWR